MMIAGGDLRIPAPYNAATYLNTPTPDGTGKATHPSVVDMAGLWNGYRFWMAHTPYAGGAVELENPCILASNDGLTWVVPAGLTNPIDPWPGGSGYNSDPDLVHDPDTDTMYCLWRDYDGGSGLTFCYSKSTDGVTWTAQADLFSVTFPTYGPLYSPAVLRMGAGDWRMWLVDDDGPCGVITAPAIEGPWDTTYTPLTFNGLQTGMLEGSSGLWHWDIIAVGSTLYGLVIADRRSPDSAIYVITSTDGIAWSLGTTPVLESVPGAWDAELYRPTLTMGPRGTMRVWYSAVGVATDNRIGHTQIPRSAWPQPIFATGQPAVNVVVDGNSISANFYTTVGTFDNHLMTVEPLASSGATHASVAVSGASWADMIATHAASVDALWVAGATNVLVLNETINSVYQGASAATIQGQITTYLSGRLAAHPWRVIYWLTVPYGGGAEYATFNATMASVDEWVTANADTLGIEVVIDPRTIPTFDHDGTSAAAFEAYADEWNEVAAPYVHPLDPPKLQLAALIVAAMAAMRV